MKRILSKIFCATVALATVLGIAATVSPGAFAANTVVWDGSIADGFESGSGTKENPYVISTPSQLAYLAVSVNGGNTYKDKYITLDKDISLGDEEFAFDPDTGLVKVSDGVNTAYLGTGITGDKSGSNSVFDEIAGKSGVWYKDSSSKTEGSYGGVLNAWTPIGKEGARFEGNFDGANKTVSGIYINTKSAHNGLFGYADAHIENITVTSSVVLSGEYAGAIAGFNTGSVSGCSVFAVIGGGSNNTGAVAGYGGKVSSCLGASWVSGLENVGGTVGFGYAVGSMNTGCVYGYSCVGGITGRGGSENCLNLGEVSGVENVGGISGLVETGELSTCINAGTARGTAYVGAILGRSKAGRVSGCYYLENSAADSSQTVQGGIGYEKNGSSRPDENGFTNALTADGMKKSASFAGFDFENVWARPEDTKRSTPVLSELESLVHTHIYDDSCDATCNTCTYVREITHDFSKEWKNDEKGHWHQCERCQERADESEHKSSGPATESAPNVCTECGYVIEPKLEHKHDYGKAPVSDENNHWYQCACGEKLGIVSHIYDDSCDKDCNACGRERTVVHSFAGEWLTDKDNHWRKCKVCGVTEEPSSHAYDNSCDTDCNVCTHKRSITHNFGSTWYKDENKHWHQCTCGEKNEIASHRWDGGTVTLQPTTQNFGVRTYACRDCGATKEEKIDKLPVVTPVTTTKAPITTKPPVITTKPVTTTQGADTTPSVNTTEGTGVPTTPVTNEITTPPPIVTESGSGQNQGTQTRPISVGSGTLAPDTTGAATDEAPDKEGGYLALTVVLGMVSVALLVVLLVMVMYLIKNKED